MGDIDVKCARLRCRLPVYQRRVRAAREVIKDGLSRSVTPFVACSFGKDSAALLHLVMQDKPDIPVRFIRWPETDLLDDYTTVIEAWRQLGARIHILDLRRATLDESVPDRWRQLNELAPADGSFIGLRKQENRVRRLRLNQDGPVYRVKSTGLWRICPLANWQTEDVAAYIVQHDLPTLGTYHREGFLARTASRIPRDQYNIRSSTLFNLRQRDPAAWTQLIQIYPELAHG